MRLGLIATFLALLFGLSGCADLGYYWQSVNGHLALLQAARPVDEWLMDVQTPEKLKARLALTQKIRNFAVSELKLPDNASYQRYADLHRKAVVWNVVAAPELSLTLKTWCFPVAGCVGYRGYFSEAEAKLEAERLKAQDFEVSVYGVPAYSTLGWSNWAGGDPLLSTFISYPEGELARIVFHELAHQVAYAPGDTAFNESFATAVERLGGARWLATYGTDAAKAEYAMFDGRRQQFRALTRATRLRLLEVYRPIKESNMPLAGNKYAYDAMKSGIFDDFKVKYVQLKEGWNGFAGYDAWVKSANNASFGALAAYDDGVPQFEALFAQQGGDWVKFFESVQKLAKMTKEERDTAFKVILNKTL